MYLSDAQSSTQVRQEVEEEFEKLRLSSSLVPEVKNAWARPMQIVAEDDPALEKTKLAVVYNRKSVKNDMVCYANLRKV